MATRPAAKANLFLRSAIKKMGRLIKAPKEIKQPNFFVGKAKKNSLLLRLQKGQKEAQELQNWSTANLLVFPKRNIYLL